MKKLGSWEDRRVGIAHQIPDIVRAHSPHYEGKAD